MNIELENYLSDEEIQNIVKEEFREAIRKNIQICGVSTWISNIGYKNVFEIINSEIPDYENQVKEKVKEVIEHLTDYSVFRKKDFVDREDSLGQKYLEQSIENNKDIIEEKVIEIFKELGKQDIASEITSIIEEKMDKIFTDQKVGGEEYELF